MRRRRRTLGIAGDETIHSPRCRSAEKQTWAGRGDLVSKKTNLMLLGALILLIVAGSIAGYLVWSRPGAGPTVDVTPSPTVQRPGDSDPIATVKTEAITYGRYRAKLEAELKRIGKVPPTDLLAVKYDVLRSMMADRVFDIQVKEHQITYTAEEVDKHISEMVNQSIAAQFGGDVRRFEEFLRARGQTEKEYREEERARIAKDREMATRSLLENKLREAVTKDVTMTDDQLRNFWREIRIQRIVFRAGDVERGKPPRPVNEARKLAEQVLEQVKSGKDFADLAKTYSQEPEEAARGGVYRWPDSREEWIPRLRPVQTEGGQAALVPVFGLDFERNVFKLKVGEVSGIFATPRPKDGGLLEVRLHIVKVIDERIRAPRDLSQRMEDYRALALDVRKSVAYLDWLDKLQDTMELTILDPELEAYRLQVSGEFNKALAKYEEALEIYPEDRLSIKHGMAVCHNAELEYTDAEKILKELTEEAPDEIGFRIEYALFLHQQARPEEAVAQLQKASEIARDDVDQHALVLAIANRIGADEFAEKENQLIEGLLKPTPAPGTPSPKAGTPSPAARGTPMPRPTGREITRPTPRATARPAARPTAPPRPTPLPHRTPPRVVTPKSEEPGGWIPTG